MDSGFISYEKFLEFKKYNNDLPPELLSFETKKNNKRSEHRNNNSSNNYRDNKPKTAWGLVGTNSKTLDTEENTDAKLYEQFRSILNKLSDSNLKELSEELVNLNIKTQEHLEKLVDIIFTKAINETNYINTYSQLIKEISSFCIETNVNNNSKQINVKDLLFCKCENAFNECISYGKEIENPQHANYRNKKIINGTMLFVGALYNNELLINRIIYSCFCLLFTKEDSAYVVDNICSLMTLVGKKFCKKCINDAKNCFETIEKIKDKPNLPKKDKFAIMALIDLKNKERWL